MALTSDSFKEILARYCQNENINIKLKEEQIQALHSISEYKDCICILPTAFGKSLIFHLACLLLKQHIIVISPISALIKDQLMILKSKGIQACGIDILGKTVYQFRG